MSSPQDRRGVSNVDSRNTRGVTGEGGYERGEKNHQSSEVLSLDEIFRLLSNRRRREVLQYLTQREGDTVTIDELARHLAAQENDVEVAQISSKQRKRAYVALHQNHLKMLDKFGIIDHDKNRGTVVLRDISPVLPYLSDQEDTDRSYHSLYVATVVSGLVTTGLLGLGPLSAIPTATWAVLSTAALVLVAIERTVNSIW